MAFNAHVLIRNYKIDNRVQVASIEQRRGGQTATLDCGLVLLPLAFEVVTLDPPAADPPELDERALQALAWALDPVVI